MILANRGLRVRVCLICVGFSWLFVLVPNLKVGVGGRWLWSPNLKVGGGGRWLVVPQPEGWGWWLVAGGCGPQPEGWGWYSSA